ncbi:MAG: DnaJ domain-containing protein [Betaproteobacteria bacterium]|nr:DnaJ domain-containing protein [Betaproteobacteria bacterium]
MAPSRESLYDALGVPPGARPVDIERAYERLVAEFRKDTTPPDPRREARIREAYQVLSDEQRRAEYDRLRQAPPPASDRRRIWVVGGLAAVIVVVAGYFAFGRSAAPGKPERGVAEIQADLVPSLGRVESFDISGKATPTGFAFTIANGVMATTCTGLASGAQVVVTIGTRAVPARVSASDEALGLCQLAVDGAGSWPLSLGAEPRAGDTVYAAGVGGTGEVVLVEGKVKRVFSEAQARIVEAGVPVGPGMGGRPLLDVQGRVVAVATAAQPGGDARHVTVPAGWSDIPTAR